MKGRFGVFLQPHGTLPDNAVPTRNEINEEIKGRAR